MIPAVHHLSFIVKQVGSQHKSLVQLLVFGRIVFLLGKNGLLDILVSLTLLPDFQFLTFGLY